MSDMLEYDRWHLLDQVQQRDLYCRTVIDNNAEIERLQAELAAARPALPPGLTIATCPKCGGLIMRFEETTRICGCFGLIQVAPIEEEQP